MKNIALIILMASVLGLGVFMALDFRADQSGLKMESTGFAVVELYTSEGCSSCPPADKLLSKITADARQHDKPVYTLAFHVDYWNYLGWKDIYSSSAYSQRQKRYAKLLNSHVYTPQMIVNGKNEFVGSNKYKANRYIKQALNRDSSISIDLDARYKASDQMVAITTRLNRLRGGYQLNAAVVERGLSREIKRGENRGKTLHHDNVVRAFRTFSLEQMKSEVLIPVPVNLDPNKASAIVYLQDKETGAIDAAQKQDL